MVVTASQAVFDADHRRLNAALESAGAVVTLDDGTRAIDPERAPAPLLRTYRLLMQYGYANGLLP